MGRGNVNPRLTLRCEIYATVDPGPPEDYFYLSEDRKDQKYNAMKLPG